MFQNTLVFVLILYNKNPLFSKRKQNIKPNSYRVWNLYEHFLFYLFFLIYLQNKKGIIRKKPLLEWSLNKK